MAAGFASTLPSGSLKYLLEAGIGAKSVEFGINFHPGDPHGAQFDLLTQQLQRSVLFSKAHKDQRAKVAAGATRPRWGPRGLYARDVLAREAEQWAQPPGNRQYLGNWSSTRQ